jgi:photosystem II stability/assembly factor-like uncharacterized protein
MKIFLNSIIFAIIMRFKSCVLATLGLFLLFGCFGKKINKETSNIQKSEFPGYYEQWLYIKTNGSMQLPDLSKYNWDITSAKRGNSNALLNVYEYGPDNVAGRIRALVIDYSNPNHILAGGASGGVFVSENKGVNWTPINDQALSPSITYMDQNPFNAKVIYYCTGEASGNSADLLGKGVFKSTDGGYTFNQLASTDNSNFEFCWSLKCSVSDTNTLYVATHSQGVWKSTDAGQTFSRVYNTGNQVNDLEVFPNGSVMFTVKGAGVYRSESGDINTFSKVVSINSTYTARSELAYCKNFPNVVYAAVSGPDDSYNGVLKNFYKSSDGGKTFVLTSNPNGTVGFGFTWYCMTMEVKANDSNSVFIASVTSGYSKNGGTTWYEANDQHSDHHIARSVGNEIYVGSDGGLCYYGWNSTFNNYTNLNNRLNITQVYQGSVSPLNQNVMVGNQDNGTKESRNFNKAFSTVYGGDGGHCFYHASKSNTRYFSTQNGNILKNGISIANNLPTSNDAKWFIHPFMVSSTYGEYVTIPANRNWYYSKDEGSNFVKLGGINTGRLYASAISEHANPSAFTGGNLSLMGADSVNNSKPNFVNLYSVLPPAIKGSFIGSIKVVPGFRDKIYLALSNVSDSGKIWMVSDFFGTPVFTNISGNLPVGLPVNWIECDPLNPETVLFAGTDYGLYVTEDGGKTWEKDTRIPSTVVSCIQIYKNNKDIYFFTHGRGVFKGQINNSAVSNVNSIALDIMKSAYPVPASSNLNMEFKESLIGKYKVVDMNGRIMSQGALNGKTLKINVESLSTGNYILMYEAEQGSGSFKFIVSH